MSYGLTDLERGKYLPGGTNVSSTVRVQQTGYPTRPVENYLYQVEYLKTSSNVIDQDVDGSVTPVDYLFSWPTQVYVNQLTVCVVGLNMASVMDYFNIAGGLTNGILLYAMEGAFERPIFTIKRTIELSHASTQGISTNQIQGNTSEDIFIANMVFPYDSVMGGTRKLGMRVRDNLSSLRYQRSSVIFREILP